MPRLAMMPAIRSQCGGIAGRLRAVCCGRAELAYSEAVERLLQEGFDMLSRLFLGAGLFGIGASLFGIGYYLGREIQRMAPAREELQRSRESAESDHDESAAEGHGHEADHARPTS